LPGWHEYHFLGSLINRRANCVSRISILNPEKVAPLVIGKMLKRKAVIVPGRMNQLSMLLNKLLPSFIKNIVTARLMNDLRPLPLPSVIIQKDPSYKAA